MVQRSESGGLGRIWVTSGCSAAGMRNEVGRTTVLSPASNGSGSCATRSASAKGGNSAGSVSSYSLFGESWVASMSSVIDVADPAGGFGPTEGG